MPFDPNQPRDPKGTTTGGQWTSEMTVEARGLIGELLLGKRWRAASAEDPAEATRLAENPAEAFVRPGGEDGGQARMTAKHQVVESLTEAMAASKLTDDQLVEFARAFPSGIDLDDREGPQDPAARERYKWAMRGAQGLVDQWAESSADTEIKSIAVQYAANDLMGSPPMYTPPSWGERNVSTIRMGKEMAEEFRPVFDVALGHIYERTQRELKAAGIETVELYRGLTVPRAEFTVPLEQAHVGSVRMQPLSSFSSSVDTAAAFGPETLYGTTPTRTGQVAVMVAVRVPRSQVFSTAQTGPGCLREGEFIVFGDRPTQAVYAGTQNPDLGPAWFPERVAAASGRATLPAGRT
jgi:hypothetical protein